MNIEELLIEISYYIVKLSNEKNTENIKKELVLIKTFLIMGEEDKIKLKQETGIYYKKEDLINRGNYLINKLKDIHND